MSIDTEVNINATTIEGITNKRNNIDYDSKINF